MIKWPIYAKRWILHFTYFIPLVDYSLSTRPPNLLYWMGDFISYSIDIIGITDLVHVIHILSKYSIRPLSEEEKNIAKIIFKDKIDLSQVWIDDKSRLWMDRLAFAWVFFNTINYQDKISMPIFCHELVHIWQFQHFGSMYIIRALSAQNSRAGYDYGGVEGLYQRFIKGDSLLDLNFEQQGAVIEDFVKTRYYGEFSSPMEMTIYHSFVKDLELS